MAKDTGLRASTFTMTRAQAVCAANPTSSRKFGGRFVVRAGKFTASRATTARANVVIEFPGLRDRAGLLSSPEYQDNIKVRQPHSIADLVIIEGYEVAA